MFSKTHELMISGIFALRSWCKEHLPIENSLIAYDLILVLAINNYAKNDISIKELFASVPHSYTAVRGHYLRFVKDGWVEHYLDSSDRRIKYVRPTPKLVKTMNDYANTANKIMLKSIDWSFYREGGGHRLPLTHPLHPDRVVDHHTGGVQGLVWSLSVWAIDADPLVFLKLMRSA